MPCPTGCTLTQGYWKTHSIRGPAPFDDAWNLIEQLPYAPGDADGIKEAEAEQFFYSDQTWYQAFWTPPSGGNAYYQLAHQYQAAVLNVLNGADPSVVNATLDAALVLLNNPANTPASIGALKGNAALRKQFVELAGILGLVQHRHDRAGALQRGQDDLERAQVATTSHATRWGRHTPAPPISANQ